MSPRLARMSVIFRTALDMGTVTTTSSSTGVEELPLLPNPPPRKDGVDVPDPEPEGRDAAGTPGKFVFSVNRTSNSDPFGPNDFRTSTKAGRKSFSMCEGEVSSNGSIGRRSVSYPARMNRPSGGIKLSSPGRSLHRASLTQGWNTGSSILRLIPCGPAGVVNVNKRSGTPDTLELNAIVPIALAESIRPDGAMVTDRFSIISTYSSLDVWRTPGLRHGIAGPEAALAGDLPGNDAPSVGEDVLIKAACKHDCLHDMLQASSLTDDAAREKDQPRQSHPSQQLVHPARNLDYFLQRIDLGVADQGCIAHLGQ